MRKIKKKIMAMCAMIMTIVMLLDITPFSVYATADIATPTDAGMGELVFVPESKEGEAYRPVKAGAAGVVYEVYDDRGSLAGEFVLSYDGRAYAGSDGETLVYTSEDAGKETGKQEKTLKLKAGAYTLKQSGMLYKSEETVETAAGICRDTAVYTMDVTSGSTQKARVVLTNKEAVAVSTAATPTDALKAAVRSSSAASLAAAKTYKVTKGSGFGFPGGNTISYEFNIPAGLTYGGTGKGFCMQEGVIAPDGEYGVLSVVDNDNIRRALYYSYVGVSPWSGWTGMSYASKVMVLSCVLDHYYNRAGNGYNRSFGTNIIMAGQYVNWLSGQPVPKTPGDVNFKLNGKAVDITAGASYIISSRLQKSSVIKMSGGGAKASVPSGITMYTSTDSGKTYKKCSSGTFIKAGTWMYFTAPLGKTGSSKITFTGNKGYDAKMLGFATKQDIGFLGPEVPCKRTCTISWTRPNFGLKKTDTNGKALAGAEYLVYRIVDGQQVNVVRYKTNEKGVGIVTGIRSTEASGSAGDSIVKLKAGVWYYIQETSAPSGYHRNKVTTKKTDKGVSYSYEANFAISGTDGHKDYTQINGATYKTSDTGVTYVSVDTPVVGSFAMKKQVLSSDGTTAPKAGAVYTMYDSTGHVLARFTTQKTGFAVISGLSSLAKYRSLKMEDGKGSVVTKKGVKLTGIPVGTYTIKETTVPDGCEPEASGRHATLTVSDTGESLTYYKAAIHSDGTVKWSRATEKSGTWNVHYLATDISAKDPIELVIQKVDAENGKKKEAGAASLAGAVFRLEYYKGKAQNQTTGTPDNTWYIKTVYFTQYKDYKARFNKECLVNNKQYPSDPAPSKVSEDGRFELEPGSVRITEVTPPEGYLNVDESNRGYISVSSGGKITYIDEEPSITVYLDGTGNILYYKNVLDRNTLEIYEPVKRGDIEFDKKLVNPDGTTSPMASVVFKITSKSTGEYHYVVTDSNGHFSSRDNSNTYNTNKNCREYAITEDGYTEGEADSSYGLWFTGNADIDCEDIEPESVSDDRGALPYDTYIIEEMRCDANRGYILSEPQEVTVTENGQVVSADEDFINVPYPQLTTLADHSVISGRNVTVKDEISFKWLKAGTDYTVKGVVMDKSTGSAATDGEGRFITSVKTFTTPSEGSVYGFLPSYSLKGEDAATFSFNSIGMDSSYVIFEYLYEGTDETELAVDDDGIADTTGAMTDAEGNPVAHADIDNVDGSQTFTVPKLETDAFADENGLQEIQATKETKITDKVTCYNIVPGEEYKLETKAVFSKDGAETFLKNGNEELTKSTPFTAKDSTKTVTVQLPVFDATPYDGCTITVYQYLYMVTDGGDVMVAEHTDIDNARQQIKFVGLHTTAQDTLTGDNFTSSIDKEREYTDYVTCTNLTVGRKYTIKTYLYERDSKDKVRNSKGEEISNETTFVADKENMTVPVTVKYNPVECGLTGKISVFFEYMTTLGKNVACHADISDEGQSLKHPKLHTTLHESGTAVKEIQTAGIVNLTDTADYTNLKKGYTFDFEAKFVNADTGRVISIDGRDAVVRKTVNATDDDGSIDMDYSFDIGKSGLIKSDGTVSDVVCYEYVYYKGDLLFAEEDITNRDQTISISPMNGKLIIHKRESYDQTKALSGVTFMLFKKASSLISGADNEDTSAMTSAEIKDMEKWKKAPDDMYAGTYVTDRNGDIEVTGLTYGKYYIVETKTLDTYYLCKDKPEFVIDATHNAEITVTNEAKCGYLTLNGPTYESQGGWYTPSTGDNKPIVFFFAMFAVASAGILFVIAKKRKLKAKRATKLILMLVITAAGIAAYNTDASAAGSDDYVTETATETYYTEDESTYDFKFDDEMESKDIKYTLDHVEYQKQPSGEKLTVTDQVTKTLQKVAENYKAADEITENGYTYVLSDSSVTSDNKPVNVTSYKDTAYLTSEPVPDSTMNYVYEDEDGNKQNVTLTYQRTEKLDTGYSADITYTGVIKGFNYEYIEIDGRKIPSESFALSESDIKSVLGSQGYDVSLMDDFTAVISPESYTDEDGNVCRNYTVTAKQYGTKYRMFYEGTADDITYTAVDVYTLSSADKEKIDRENSAVNVTATAYYKAVPVKSETGTKMSTAKKVVLATSIILGLLVLAALAIYVIMGGRKATDRKSRRDIRRDYRNL